MRQETPGRGNGRFGKRGDRMILRVDVPDNLLSVFRLALDATILNLDCVDLTKEEVQVIRILRRWVEEIPESEE